MFRKQLERHGRGRKMLSEVNGYLKRHGLKIGTGTVVDTDVTNREMLNTDERVFAERFSN